MSIKGSIAGLVGIVALGLTTYKVDLNENYHYDGIINGNYVVFKEVANRFSHNDNYLIVDYADGIKIVYQDNKNNDLQIDDFVVMWDDLQISSKNYTNKDYLLKGMQKNFDDYLTKIIKEKNGDVNRKSFGHGFKKMLYDIQKDILGVFYKME